MELKHSRPREQAALKLLDWGNALVGRLKVEELNDQLLPSRCMNPNLTSAWLDGGYNSQPSKQERARTKAKRKELREPDSPILIKPWHTCRPCGADLTCISPSIFNHIFNIHHTFPLSSKVQGNRRGLGHLEKPSVFKLSKFRLHEHEKMVGPPNGPWHHRRPRRNSQRAAMAALHAVRVLEGPSQAKNFGSVRVQE
jgi:hypothetical protein